MQASYKYLNKHKFITDKKSEFLYLYCCKLLARCRRVSKSARNTSKVCSRKKIQNDECLDNINKRLLFTT